LGKLRYLDLSRNYLGWGQLLKDAFTGLEQLEILNLDYNNLGTDKLTVDTFYELPALRNLTLNGNNLQSFKPVLKYDRETRLVLANNRLSNATLSGWSPTHVCLVDYTKSGLTSLTKGNFKNIMCKDPDGISLIFAWNSFISFDTKMFDGLGGNIKELDFSGVTMVPALIKNFISAITGWNISTLRLAETLWTRENLQAFAPLNTTYIRNLDLSYNIIAFSGAAETKLLSYLQTVEYLDLSYNDVISSLHFEVPMPNLHYLALSSMAIPISPDSLSFEKNSALGSLEILILDRSFDLAAGCPARREAFSKSSWFRGLDSLKVLSLANNIRLFRCFSDRYFLNFFKGLKNLQNLSLSWTDFGERDPSMPGYSDIFSDQANTMSNLSFLGGFITHRHISAGLIRNLHNLTYLNFQANEIGYLFPEFFETLSNLKVLLLHDNKITTVQPGVNNQLFPNTLSLLTIGQNAFSCDCNLRLFAEWLKTDKSKAIVRDANKVICLTPLEYYKTTKKVKDFPEDFWKSLFVCSHGIALTSAAGVALLIIVIATLFFCCRHDAKYLMATRRLRARTGDAEPLLPPTRVSVKLIYDIRDRTDRQWINTYIDNITGCRDFDITTNHPDDIHVPGEDHVNPLSKQIRDFRNQCYHSLLLVSNHFKDDLWPEIHANLSRQELQNIRFVLVLIENLRLRDLPRELKTLAKQRPCFKWPTETNGGCCAGTLGRRRQVFFRKLILALLPQR
jgi:Leucine-rich repeat (LRR) protein